MTLSSPVLSVSTERHDVANAVVVMVLTTLAGVAVLWGLQLVLVRQLSRGEWETMSRFLTIMISVPMLHLGLPESVLYFAARCRSSAEAVRLTIRTSLVLAAFGMLLAGLLLTVPGLSTLLLGNGSNRHVLLLAAFITAELVFAPLPPLLIARKQPRAAAVLGIATRIPLALGVAVAIGLGLGLNGAMWGMAAGSLLSVVIGYGAVARMLRPHGLLRAAVVGWREQLGFSFPVGIARYAQSGNSHLDKYFIMAVPSGAVFGGYYLGAVEFPVPGLLCTAVMTVMTADLVGAAARGSKQEFLRLWHTSVEKIAMITLPLVLFLVTFADPIFHVLYGREYSGAAMIFRLFQLGLLIRVSNYTRLAMALGKPRVPLIAAVVAICLTGGLSVLLYRPLGIAGPAVARVVALYASTIYSIIAVRFALGVPWRDLWPFRFYFKTLILAVVAVVPSLAAFAWGLQGAPAVIMGAVLYFSVYISLATVTGVIGPTDRAFFWGLLRGDFLRHQSQPPIDASNSSKANRGGSRAA
jgi:O-antigen/teichoic acid export membrane protein